MERRQHQDAVDDDDVAERQPEQADALLDRGDLAQRGGGDAAHERGAEREEMPKLQFAEAGAHDEQHAAEAGGEEEPALPGDVLMQDEARQSDDEDRREEGDRIGLGHRNVGECVDNAEIADDAGETAQVHQPGVAHVVQLAPMLAPGLGEDRRDEGEERRPERDLEDAEAAAEAFDDGVTTRVEQVGYKRKRDANGHLNGNPKEGGKLVC